jgi:hypothetical protein
MPVLSYLNWLDQLKQIKRIKSLQCQWRELYWSTNCFLLVIEYWGYLVLFEVQSVNVIFDMLWLLLLF